jgi:hypothetical protein
MGRAQKDKASVDRAKSTEKREAALERPVFMTLNM